MTQPLQRRQLLKKPLALFLLSLVLVLALSLVLMQTTAQATAGVSIDFIADDTEGGSMGVIDVIVLMVLLTLIPSVLLMMTSFTRIIIVLSLTRSAMGTQQAPPNQVLVGLALLLTLFIMTPTLSQVNEQAYQPYRRGELTSLQAVEAAQPPLKRFMLRQTSTDALNLFLNISNTPSPEVGPGEDAIEKLSELSLFVVVPAFVTSELERAFIMGFLIYLPFLIIDIVVSSVLMSMGMVMLPPATIALPFKILMFLLVNGWNLVLGTLSRSFL